jgi:D-sedoheptulose 7-phosphate isomerase
MTTDANLVALYPFLQPGRGPDAAVAVAESTRAKIHEAAALRSATLDREAERLRACAAAVASELRYSGRLLACGNGGSATDAQALADLFTDPPAGGSLPALALTTDVAIVSALANDVSVDAVFARQIAAYARPHDIVVGLSTSGNSANVIAACGQARRLGLLTVGFAGGTGGRMAGENVTDHLFCVTSASVHRIQETQTTLCHVLWQLIVADLRGDPDLPPLGGPGDE